MTTRNNVPHLRSKNGKTKPVKENRRRGKRGGMEQLASKPGGKWPEWVGEEREGKDTVQPLRNDHSKNTYGKLAKGGTVHSRGCYNELKGRERGEEVLKSPGHKLKEQQCYKSDSDTKKK